MVRGIHETETIRKTVRGHTRSGDIYGREGHTLGWDIYCKGITRNGNCTEKRERIHTERGRLWRRET